MITAANVKALNPTLFSSYDDSLVTLWIDISKTFVNEDKLGSNYDLALKLFTAHLLILSSRAESGGGKVTSETGGDLSRSFGEVDSKSTLTSTTYGLLYWNLIRSMGFMVSIV